MTTLALMFLAGCVGFFVGIVSAALLAGPND